MYIANYCISSRFQLPVFSLVVADSGFFAVIQRIFCYSISWSHIWSMYLSMCLVALLRTFIRPCPFRISCILAFYYGVLLILRFLFIWFCFAIDVFRRVVLGRAMLNVYGYQMGCFSSWTFPRGNVCSIAILLKQNKKSQIWLGFFPLYQNNCYFGIKII